MLPHLPSPIQQPITPYKQDGTLLTLGTIHFSLSLSLPPSLYVSLSLHPSLPPSLKAWRISLDTRHVAYILLQKKVKMTLGSIFFGEGCVQFLFLGGMYTTKGPYYVLFGGVVYRHIGPVLCLDVYAIYIRCVQRVCVRAPKKKLRALGMCVWAWQP
jgi:hypothetical protein